MGGNPNPKNQFKPGQSGNPKGRPKKDTSLTELMKEFLTHIPEGQEKTYKELFIQKCLQMAMKGDMQAIKLLWNYIDGMPQQDFTGNIDANITFGWQNSLKSPTNQENGQ